MRRNLRMTLNAGARKIALEGAELGRLIPRLSISSADDGCAHADAGYMKELPERPNAHMKVLMAPCAENFHRGVKSTGVKSPCTARGRSVCRVNPHRRVASADWQQTHERPHLFWRMKRSHTRIDI